MTSDEFFPIPDDDLLPPQDDQPESGPGDRDDEGPIAGIEEPGAAAPEDEPIASEDEQEDAGEPVPPALPRIVAEQPVGAGALPAPLPQPEPPAPPSEEPASAEIDQEPAPEAAADVAAEPEPAPAVTDEVIETLPVVEAEEPGEAPPVEPEPAPAATDEVIEMPPVAEAEEPEPIRSRSALSAPAPEAEPAEKARVEDWDEEISPELAAILFAGAAAAAEAPAREEAAPTAEEIPAPEETVPAPPAARPVNLIDVSDARRLPITAQGVASPAPEEQPVGKARYVRIEEPLGKDDGQRISETWSYLKPDYPALGGRLVRRVHIEEYRFADGSWKWTFERQYTDRGRDTREVRANRDRTYIERRDRIARKDASANRRVRVHEKAEMILAGPEKEEKRGLLGRLFGRGEKTGDGPAEWRPATPSEARSARSDGGQAFGRKLFGLF